MVLNPNLSGGGGGGGDNAPPYPSPPVGFSLITQTR